MSIIKEKGEIPSFKTNKEHMNIVVWSKNRCRYCEEAKYLLKSNDILFEERNIESGNWTREQFLEANPTARTFPQVWINGLLIGGFTELQKHLQ